MSFPAGIDRDNLLDQALSKLFNDVIKKTDGCSISASFDSNDWLQECSAQVDAYNMLIEFAAWIETLRVA